MSKANRDNSKPAPERQGVRAMRRCLSCGLEFYSEWAGNRVCFGCKRAEGWNSPVGNFAVAGLRVTRETVK